MADYPYVSGVTLFGSETTDSVFPVFCDHTHLYSFYYDTVLPANTADSDTDLNVWGWTMTGFPGLCTYTDWSAFDRTLKEGHNVAVFSDEFAWFCGWYAEYEWSGTGDVFFEIHSMDAVAKAATSFALVALSALYL